VVAGETLGVKRSGWRTVVVACSLLESLDLWGFDDWMGAL
jgi:hypothetical protein